MAPSDIREKTRVIMDETDKVTAPVPPSFTLSVSPSSGSLAEGASGYVNGHLGGLWRL